MGDDLLDRMRTNPAGDWTIGDIQRLCRLHHIDCKPPSGGGSHYKIAHVGAAADQAEVYSAARQIRRPRDNLCCEEAAMTKLAYRVVIEPLSKEDGGGYFATVPDLPGCMSDGETPEDALLNVQDAIRCWIEAATEMGRDVPQPTRTLAAAE